MLRRETAALSADVHPECSRHTEHGKSFCNLSGRHNVAVIIPPMKSPVAGLRAMDRMARDVFGFSLLTDCMVEPLIHCVPPQEKVPAKLVQVCTCHNPKMRFAKFAFLVGPVVQKSMVGSSPNIRVSGGCGVVYKGGRYILLPDPFLYNTAEDEDELKDILRLYLNSIRKAERHVREWLDGAVS